MWRKEFPLFIDPRKYSTISLIWEYSKGSPDGTIQRFIQVEKSRRTFISFRLGWAVPRLDTRYPSYFLKTRAAFVPPNPNELESTYRIEADRALLGT